MGAEDHEEKAAKHAEKAEGHDAKYDPNAPVAVAFEGADTEFNPTEVHNIQAQRHRKHADEHLEAAATLERAEQGACASVPADSRSWCPLLGPVSATENTRNGVRITVKSGTDVKGMIARIRCHIAFADTQGREGMGRCPLYVKGVEVQQVGPDTIELNTKRKAEVRELQERVAKHIGE